MNFGGWLMMTLCVGGVTLLFGWSIHMVLRGDRSSKLHSDAERPPDVDE